MKKILIYFLGFTILSIIACSGNNDRFNIDREIPDFDFPQTAAFKQNLSSYNIFQGSPSDLRPSSDFHLLELSSTLFTDHAHKQRLVKLPSGTQMIRLNDGALEFPDGSLLVKTFYYYKDERDTTLGKRIIETRLLLKENNIWNLATYIWNEAQTEASLNWDGSDTAVNWIDAKGNKIATPYHVPNQNECIACHQSNSTITPIGPRLRNLNRIVERNGASLNQINHLQALGILNDFSTSQVPQIVDYNDFNMPLAARARAYLAMNCAHCHQPNAWEKAAEKNFDFRYETSLNQTGIPRTRNKILQSLSRQEMPLIGTTSIDEEGIWLIFDFLRSL